MGPCAPPFSTRGSRRGYGDLLRVADDREGKVLWPTAAEEREAARAEAEQEAIARTAAEARAVDETAARVAAEARVKELEALLAQQRRG